ncbi:MAG: hypothetical protein V3U98_03550 [Acidobacteriota bacterium]
MRSLLEQMKALIERTYDLSTGIDNIGAFVIGDEGWRALYADADLTSVVRSGHTGTWSGAAARLSGCAPFPAGTLVRQVGNELRLSLYYPKALIDHLESHHPLRCLDEANIDGFAVFVEELDHLLHIAHRSRLGRELTLLELEWQANLTKYLVTRHLLAKRLSPRPFNDHAEHWVCYHLFEKPGYTGDSPEVIGRYRDAVRLAVRTIRKIRTLPPAALLTELRAFAGRSFTTKLHALAH